MTTIWGDFRPPTRSLPVRANRMWYWCPECGRSTEHRFLQADEFDESLEGKSKRLVVSMWECVPCGLRDVKMEDYKEGDMRG